MNYKKSPYAIFFIITIVLAMLAIFAVITRRWSIAFNNNVSKESILVISACMVVGMMTSMALSSFAWKKFEIVWTIMLWSIYAILILAPLIIFRDIVSIWYSIPPLFMIGWSLLWLGFGLYKWTKIKITPFTITNKNIKKDHKIIFISDIHADAIRDHRYIQKIVHHIQKIEADLVLIGGDLMNSAKISNVHAFLPFNQVKIPIYTTLGNHDHMGDSRALTQIFEKTNIIPLRNQSIEIDGLQIIGIDDKSYRGEKKLHEILDESMQIEKNKFSILISHQPQHLSKLEKHEIDLELAGHTHHGQFIPLSWMIRLFNDYAYGKYRYKDMTAFVSQGIGSWWAPIRIGTQSELVLISLKST